MAKATKTDKKQETGSEDVETRTSFNITHTKLKKVRYISLLTEVDITDLVNNGLDLIIAEYEKKNGAIPIK